MGRIAVVAIGGNSLIKDKDHQTVPDQFDAVRETCTHIADLVEAGYEVVITHGNGPQVGFILLRSEAGRKLMGLHTVPMDICGADTQGSIGYMIQQSMQHEFFKRGIQKNCVTVVTQVIVDRDDPAFINPTKPVGPFYSSKEEAEIAAGDEKWVVKEDAGRGWRRVVPSPIPRRVVEIDAVRKLVSAGFVVVAVGGGGIPVIEVEEGRLEGVAAVIDKDYASSLLASEIGAELFIISTAVPHVYINFGKPDQKALDKVDVIEAKRYLDEKHFAEGSMAPKVRAIISFLERGGKKAIITSPELIGKSIKGEAGTLFVP